MRQRKTYTLLLISILWIVSSLFSTAKAQTSQERRITGFSWDLQIEAGVGYGLDSDLKEHFLGRIQAGVLWGYEPIIVNLGIAGELGGLASEGVGLALELNHFGGPFARLGVSYIEDDEWMSRVSAGFGIIGLEWQHILFSDQEPHSALFLLLRAPLGVFWFLSNNS